MSKLSVHLLIVILFMSVLSPLLSIQEAKSIPSSTTIPFTSGNVAPYIVYDSVNERAWASKYASGGSDQIGGLFRWDRANGTLKQFIIPSSMEDGSTIQATGIILDASNTPWVATTRKLYKFSPQDGVFTIITNVAFGYEMVFDGTYIWLGYRDGVLRVNPSTQAVGTIQISDNKAFAFLTPFNSGVLVVDVASHKVYEVSSALDITERLTGLSEPLGITCSGTTCYLAEHALGQVLEINTATWGTTIRNVPGEGNSSSKPTDVVIYQTWAVVLDGTKFVRIFNIPAWTSFVNVTLSFMPLYGSVDPLGRVYVGYCGSAGFVVIENLFEVEPVPQPQPPCNNCQGNDQREPIKVQLSQSQTMRKGSEMNVNVSLSSNTTGVISLYSGDSYLGRELIAYREFKDSSLLNFKINADWLGTKSVFARFSGNLVHKGNVSNYITLTSIEPKRGIDTIKSEVVSNSKIIQIKIQNMDSYFKQNYTILVQIKDTNGVVQYLAFLDVVSEPNQLSTTTFGGDIPRGFVEVFVWKSIKETIPLAEVRTIRN